MLCTLVHSITFACTTLRAFFTAFKPNLSDSSPCVQLPTTVKETYKRGQQMAAEKDAQGEDLVVVPVSQVKEGALPSVSGAGGREVFVAAWFVV